MGNVPSHKDIFIPLNWARQGAAKTDIGLVVNSGWEMPDAAKISRK
jgi:hypothetical protein